MRLPKHIGIIPDGNRRWALEHGMKKEDGYINGIAPGMKLYRMCRDMGIEEMTFYGFTADNTKRPSKQRIAFSNACIDAVKVLSKEHAELLVIGNRNTPMFPEALLPYTTRQIFGKGGMKINFLINYSWEWDLGYHNGQLGNGLASQDISRIDLVIRWGGRRRLSGFLPIQSVYADMYVVDDYWPDFTEQHMIDALVWYAKQDITLGG